LLSLSYFMFILLSSLSVLVFAQNEQLLGSSGKVTWFTTNEDTITVMVETNSKVGWLGIGWHSLTSDETGMKDADIVVGWFDEKGEVTVVDCMGDKTGSGHYVYPDTEVGGTNDVYSWSGSQQEGRTTFSFQRKLVTNDTVADSAIANGFCNAIWAFGNGWPSYHGQANRGTLKINFITGTAEQNKNDELLRNIHASLMVIAFALCMSFGIFVARYLKDYHWWFPVHVITQVMAVSLAISGFGVAISMVQGHFKTTHSWFGLAVLSLSVIAPAAGWAADLTFASKRSKTPLWPDQFHWWIGRLTVLFAYVTIILGMRLLEISIVFQLSFGAIPIIYAAMFFFIEIYRKIYSQESIEHGSLLKDHT